MWRNIYRRETKIDRIGGRGTCHTVKEGGLKSALSQHQEKTGHVVANKQVTERMKAVEKEARKAYIKVKEFIQMNLSGAMQPQ